MVAVLDSTITLTLRVIGGLAGLEEYQEYRMLASPEDGVCWLEAVAEPAIAIPCADAMATIPGYSIEIGDDIVEALALRSPEEAQVLLVIQSWDDPDRAALSAAGPIVVNRRTGHAMQLVAPGAGRILLR